MKPHCGSVDIEAPVAASLSVEDHREHHRLDTKNRPATELSQDRQRTHPRRKTSAEIQAGSLGGESS